MAVIGIGFLLGVFVISTKVNNLQIPDTQISTPIPEVSTVPTGGSGYTFDKSEGDCSIDTDCEWAGEGCGGGHGKCTNTPEKYEGSVTTCDMVPSFPANRGYKCGCVESVGKCGWKK